MSIDVATAYQVKRNLMKTYTVFVGQVPGEDQSYAYAYFVTEWPTYVGHTGNAPKRAEHHFKNSPIEWTAFVDSVFYSGGSSVNRARKLERRWAAFLARRSSEKGCPCDPFWLASNTYKQCNEGIRHWTPTAGPTLDFWASLGSDAAQWRLLQNYELFEQQVGNYIDSLIGD